MRFSRWVLLPLAPEAPDDVVVQVYVVLPTVLVRPIDTADPEQTAGGTESAIRAGSGLTVTCAVMAVARQLLAMVENVKVSVTGALVGFSRIPETGPVPVKGSPVRGDEAGRDQLTGAPVTVLLRIIGCIAVPEHTV